MKNVNFKPWVGANYCNGGLFGQKVLVLGESHYCLSDLKEGGRCYPACEKSKMRPECYSQTNDVINEFLDEYNGKPYQRTFVCFERAVVGKDLTEDERKDFWNSVVFYNYFQYCQSGPTRSLEQKNDSSEAFKEILEEYMPDRIIVWGKRLYDHLPDWGGEESFVTLDNGENTKVWTYCINNKKIPAMCVYHPSAPSGKDWTNWHRFHKIFLNLPQ